MKTSILILNFLVLTLLTSVNSVGQCVTVPSFGAGAIMESFEGVPTSASNPSAGGGFNVPVTPFTFSSGVTLTTPNPNSFGQAILADFSKGSAGFSLCSSSTDPSTVPHGSASINLNNATDVITFTLPILAGKVGLYVEGAPCAGTTITLTAYNSSNVVLGTCTVTPTGLASNWATTFLGFNSASDNIASITITGPFVVLDRLTFEAICVTVSCPPSISANNNPGVCGATVNFVNTFATSSCGTIVSITQTGGLASGSVYPIGVTTNTFLATDNNGNTATCSFTVTVVDNEAPTITCPANIVLCGSQAVTFSAPTATDNCSAIVTQTAGLASGSTFPVGTTTNTFVAADPSGNTATCSFTVTINPIPTVNAQANQTVCVGATTTATFSGAVVGTVYNWTNTNAAIGLATSGSGNISFTSTNATTAPITGTVVVTPSYTNAGLTCTGSSTSFTITVNPTATVNTVPNQVLCTGAPTAAVNFSSPTTGGTIVYNWVNNLTSIGLAASGAGNIPSFTAINTSSTGAVSVATITVTPSYTAGTVTCVGTPMSFTITVNPNPPLLITADPGTVICEGDPTLLTVMTSGGIVTSTFQNLTSIPIQDFVTNQSNIFVSGLPTVGSSVNSVTLFNINHTWAGDVDILLQSPSGQNVILMSDVGSGSASFPNRTYTYDNTSALMANTNPVPVSGSYRPTNIGASDNWPTPGPGAIVQATPALSMFTGDLNGQWKLFVYDDLGGDIGSIGGGYNIVFNRPSPLPLPSGYTFLWSPAAGLSSTTSNPVAASPMVTTTYTVNTTTGAGCTNSASITITVNNRPVVTAHPVSRANCVGTSASFTVVGTGTALTYQWQESVLGAAGPWVNITNGGVYAGATTATLTINPVNQLLTGYAYRCVLSGSCSPILTNNISSAAVLTVNPNPTVAITPAISCGGVAGISGTLLSVGAAAPPPVPGSLTTNSGVISVAIPDNNPAGVSSNLTVAGVPANATVTGVRASWTMPHTWLGDMVFALKAPNGSIINLDYYLSGTGAPGGGVSFVNTTVSSAGVNALSTGTGTYTGTFKADARPGTSAPPAGPTGMAPTTITWPALYTTPNGTWTLGMYDGGAGDVGTLTNWTITIDYTTPGTGTGPVLTYVWSPLTGLYNDATATNPYLGTITPVVYAAPTALTVYTVRGTDVATGCFTDATAIVNYTPPAPAVVPSSVTMCLGDAAVRLISSSSSSTTASASATGLTVVIPDGTGVAATHSLTVAGVPAGSTIGEVKVTMNMTHTWVGDVDVNLRAPNNAILNLVGGLNNGTGSNGTAHFVNTAFSSLGGATISGAPAPRTNTFAAEARAGYGPIGFIQTVNNWAALTPTPVSANGSWTLAMGDFFGGDVGTLTSWSIAVTYIVGVPSTAATWSPIAGLFNDAAATIPYAGTQRDTVWTRPTPSGVYPYTATVNSLPPAPAVPATNFASGNGNSSITFNVRNNNSYSVTLATINSRTFAAGATNVSAYFKPSAINGAPGAISVANGWNQFGSASITGTGTGVQPFMSGLGLVIPPGATYGICVQAVTATNGFNLSYSTLAAGTYTFSSGGCDIISGTSIGYGGVNVPAAPTFTPRGFIGSVGLVTNVTACTSPARTVVVTVNQPTTVATQPVNRTICTDKVATFTVVAAGTGPFTYRWELSTNNGNAPWNTVNNGGVYSGATTATLTITAPPVSMSLYQYRVVITGAAPCAAATSNNVVLTVNPLPVIVITAAPYTSLFPGLTTRLTSVVTPNAASTYTWLRNGVAVSGGTGASLNVDVDGLGDYRLRVTDVNGCTNTSNQITITDSVTAKCYIYPNPTSGQFQVRYHSVQNNVLPRSLTITNSYGDRVLTQFYTIGGPYARMDVDLRAFGKGVYWVEIGDLNGNRLTVCRVVVQ